MTTISAIIPTYNRYDVLVGRSLRSVLRQSWPVDEIVIVADGMEGELLDQISTITHVDPRVKFWNIPRQVYPEHAGAKWSVLGLEARNFGLDHAQGDWIAPLDDDDEWSDDHIEVLMTALSSTGADFAYGVSRYHWPDENRIQHAGAWPPGYGKLCDGSQLYRNGMGYRYDKACLERGLPEDGDLWERMYAGGVKFTFVQQVIHHYYPNPR